MMQEHLKILTQAAWSACAAVPIVVLDEAGCAAWLAAQPERVQTWVARVEFTGKTGQVCLVSDAEGQLAQVLFGLNDPDNWRALGGLANALPAGDYRFLADAPVLPQPLWALGFCCGLYQFDQYKTVDRKAVVLCVPNTQADPLAPPVLAAKEVPVIAAQVAAIQWVRDLINTSAEQLGPAELIGAAQLLEDEFGAKQRVWWGDDLLPDFPLVHAVGRASSRPPGLLDLRWGDPAQPKLTLVGKGVCFDSGGLDIKPAAGMRWMKKDMGGAAHVLGLARWIMAVGLPVQLRVLVPAVDNVISGSAIKPGDVLTSRAGKTVEIGNTDAEGRLILADALALAVEDQPDLLIDFATLTGAARVALGPDLPALFCNDDALAQAVLDHGVRVCDPLWRLPLHGSYRTLIESRIADLNNSASSPFGGAITAALFLQAFVPDDLPWLHIDLMGWNGRTQPGRPEGGEAVGLVAICDWLLAKYAPSPQG